jgi:hypothetical protein
MKIQHLISSYYTKILEVLQKLPEMYEKELNECVIYSFAEFCDGLADFPGLLDPEDEGTKILRNVGKCLPSTSASHLRRLLLVVFVHKFNVLYCLGSWAKA